MSRLSTTTFLLFLLVSTGFSAVTIETAGQVAANLSDRGESVNIKPQSLTTAGTADFWVMEIISLGRINVLVPISADSGLIDQTDAIKPVMKAHYVANFFASTESVTNFLDSMQGYAREQKDRQYRDALSQLAQLGVQVPSNVTLVTLQPLKDELNAALSSGSSLSSKIQEMRDKIMFLKSDNSKIAANDADSAKIIMEGVFVKQEDFLDSLDVVAQKTTDLLVEVAGDLKNQKPELALAFQGVTSSNNLQESTTAKRDTLTQNKNTINLFFNGVDVQVDGFLTKLRDRVSQSSVEVERKQVLAQLNDFAVNISFLLQNSDKISSTADFERLQALYNESNDAYQNADYAAAKAGFAEISSLQNVLLVEVANYNPTQCTTGQKRSCVTPGGKTGEQVCSNNLWGACSEPSGGLNFTLIGGLVLGIIVLIALIKFKGGKPPEQKTAAGSEWSGYGFKT